MYPKGKETPVVWKTLWVEEVEPPVTNNVKPKCRITFEMENVREYEKV